MNIAVKKRKRINNYIGLFVVVVVSLLLIFLLDLPKYVMLTTLLLTSIIGVFVTEFKYKK